MPVETPANLAPLLGLRLAVQAPVLCHVTGADSLVRALELAAGRGLPVVVLAGGSNMAPRGDPSALVLHMAQRGIVDLGSDGDHRLLQVAAGESWHGVVRWTLGRGLGGLENLALIPGSAGAAPVQNIGAYGVELSRWLTAVQVLDLSTGQRRELPAAACRFGYRDSLFKQPEGAGLLIEAVQLRLPTRTAWQAQLGYAGVPDMLQALGHVPEHAGPVQVAEAVVRLRRQKLPDPGREPNVGSFFKNPVLPADRLEALRSSHPGVPGHELADGSTKVPAAWLIEQAGLKGWQHPAGARVSQRHALVLVARAGMTPVDFWALVQWVQQRVQDRFGVELEPEPRDWQPFRLPRNGAT